MWSNLQEDAIHAGITPMHCLEKQDGIWAIDQEGEGDAASNKILSELGVLVLCLTLSNGKCLVF